MGQGRAGLVRAWGLAAAFAAVAAAPAWANPVAPIPWEGDIAHPHNPAAQIVAYVACLVLESLAVYAYLWRFGLRSSLAFAGLCAGNLAVFFLVFLPVLVTEKSIASAEFVAFACDAVFLWAFCRYSGLAEDAPREVEWPDATIASAIGNAISYLLGHALFG